MILSRELVVLGLAGPLRQLHVEDVEDLAYGHAVSVAPRARGIKVTPRDAWDFEEEVRGARRDGGLVYCVGVAGWMEARR